MSRTWYDAESMSYVTEYENGYKTSVSADYLKDYERRELIKREYERARDLAASTPVPGFYPTPPRDKPEYFYGRTKEEWLALEKENKELKQFIETKLEEVVKDIKSGS